MESQGFIICSLNSSFYGIEAVAVQEIFYLPELTPVAEAPPDIVGVLNLRGEILPVMDLYLRLGQQSQEYQLSDSIIVLNWQGFRVGMIVNQVHEVQNISAENITTNLSYGRDILTNNNAGIPQTLSLETTSTTKFVLGLAQVEADLVMLLNHQSLIRYSQSVNEEVTQDSEESDNFNPTQSFLNGSNDFANAKAVRQRVFCPNATPEERVVFRERAQNLRNREESEDLAGQMPLAVIGLNGEYFGLDLGAVREFTDIGKITPIPCCPPHVLGNINLRGEIVTLIDIRGVLNLPMNDINHAPKAMVVRIDDLVAGVTVDQVFDVMYLNPSEMMPVPAALHSRGDEYLRGTALYREKMMAILELPKILTKGGLTVDEEV